MHIAKIVIRLLFAILLSGFLFAQNANSTSQDLKIVTTEEDISRGFRSFVPDPLPQTTIYVHGQRFRMEIESYVSGKIPSAHRQVYVYQCDLSRVIELDVEAKLYIEMDLDSNGFPPGSTYMSAEELDALLTKEDQEKAAGTLKRPTPTVKIVDDYVDTGERKEMYGFTARRVRITRKQIPLAGAQAAPSKSESDGWYVDVAVPSHCPTSHDAVYAKHHRRLEAILTAVSFSGGDHHQQRYDSYALETHGQAESGFPVEIITTAWQTMPDARGSANTSRESTGSKVPLDMVGGKHVSIFKKSTISREPLDPALFEIPKDFARGKRSYNTGRMRPDNWIGDVEDWFHDLTRRISLYTAHGK